MTPKRWLFVAAATFAVVISIYVIAQVQPEPTYEGRTVSEWMTQALQGYPRLDPRAVTALRHMGTPAITELRQMADRQDSQLKLKILAHSNEFPLLQNLLTVHYWDRYFAIKMLGEIGPAAKAAIPTLNKLTHDPETLVSRAARAALVCIREEPLEPYFQAFHNPAATNSAQAFAILLELGPAARSLVPKLLEDLQSTNNRSRLQAIELLGRVGVESPECVPSLIEALSDPDETIQNSALVNLGNFGPLIQPAIPDIARFIASTNENLRTSALCSLYLAAPPGSLAPFRSLIEGATNAPDELTKNFAEKILNEKLNHP